MAGAKRISPQERLEGTDLGRGILSILIGITLATVLIQQLPNSYLRGKLDRIFAPYANATGLDQDWAVFAPEPRRRVIDLEGRVRYADGSTSVWRIPTADDFIGPYWDYRWRKIMEYTVPDTGAALWQPLGMHVARQQRRGSPIVSVDLVRRWSDLNRPGAGPSQTPWQEFKFFSLPAHLVRAVNLESRS